MRSQTSYFHVGFLAVMAILLNACEGSNPSKRPERADLLNGTYRMSIETIGGQEYLVVLNTNFQADYAKGSLQFYSLANPDAPVQTAALAPLSLPSNVGDFVFDGERLYVADRNENQILIFDRNGTNYVPRLKDNGKQEIIEVSANPQRLYLYTYSGNRRLAVLAQSDAIIHFINLSDLSFVDASTDGYSATARGRLPDQQTLAGKVGAAFAMKARKEENPPREDRISIGGGERLGFGGNGLALLNPQAENPIFIFASQRSNALFSFRTYTWENAANLVWDLDGFKGDHDESGSRVKGTKEEGFRGMAVDGNGTVLLSSRTDNVLYRIDRSELEADVTIDSGVRNTRGYPKDDQRHAIVANFDQDKGDNIFPRLGPMALDCTTDATTSVVSCTGGAAASVAWVLGLGDPDTASGKLFRVDLNALTWTEASSRGRIPQGIVWYNTGGANRIFVSHPMDNTISIFDGTSLELVSTISTPR